MIHFNVLREYFDNDEDMVQAVFMIYTEEYFDCTAKLNAIFESNDWAQLNLYSHSLKGALSNFGESDAVPRLELLEQKTKNRVAPSKSEITIVAEQIELINQQIKDYLSEK